MLLDIKVLLFKEVLDMKIKTPLTDQDLASLKSGDQIYLSGTIYTGRDAAHKRLVALIKENKDLPFNFNGTAIYYVGPSPKKPNQVIGSAGPTSSYRMDAYSPLLMEHGLKVMIGKGPRSEEFKKELVKHKGVYLSAVGGAAALISKSIKKCTLIAYEELGAEAIYELEVEDMPLIVTYDIYGNDLFAEGIAKHQKRKI